MHPALLLPSPVCALTIAWVPIGPIMHDLAGTLSTPHWGSKLRGQSFIFPIDAQGLRMGHVEEEKQILHRFLWNVIKYTTLIYSLSICVVVHRYKKNVTLYFAHTQYAEIGLLTGVATICR